MPISKISLIVFGASTGTGLEFVRQASDRGEKTIGVGRRPRPADLSPLSDYRSLDVREGHDLTELFSEVEPSATLISTMGGGPIGQSADGLGNLRVIEAATKAGLSRMILVTSLGCGDSRSYASERLLAAIGETLAEKTIAENALQISSLDFAILRPGRLVDGSVTGTGQLFEDPSMHGNIARAELAAVILRLARQNTLGRKVFSVVDPGQKVPV